MRTFIVFVTGEADQYNPHPNLYLETDFRGLLKRLNGMYGEDFPTDEDKSEQELADFIDESNGDGDRWYSVSEYVEVPGYSVSDFSDVPESVRPKLKLWLGY